MTRNKANLLPQHQEMLEASAISLDVASARGYKSMGSRYDQPELMALGFSKAQARIPGLLIPLYGINGDVAGHQYRPDTPRMKEGKAIKYETPKGQRNILDIPPTVRDAVRSARQAFFVTEGARKADAQASLSIPAINISGVWGWRGKNEDGGYTALSDWEDISIKGNIFVLAFDSDILTKPQVHQAISRLKAFLEGRGAAKVRVLILPQSLSGKTGVDDFIYETNATSEDLARLIVDELPSMYEDKDPDETLAVDIPSLNDLLDHTAAFIGQYVVMTPEQLDASVLFVAHAHAIEAADTSPLLNPRSAEKRSGKSRLLEGLELVVPNALRTENISVAALAHSVDKGATLLLDEVDTLFGKGKASETQEMLRGILNSGYKRGGAYVRMVGQGSDMTPKTFSTFGAKIVSGIGELPGTANDRAIPLDLKRKRPHEKVKRFRIREARAEAEPIRRGLKAWASTAIVGLREARPESPEVLDDRAADSWEPLHAIADMAGGDWPRRGRNAALILSGGREENDDSIGVRLLASISDTFQKEGSHSMATKPLLEKLNDSEEATWGGWHAGKGMSSRDLARLLKPFGIKSKDIRIPGIQNKVNKGFEAHQFKDAFSRYLPDLSATSATSGNDAAESPYVSATQPPIVADENDPYTASPSLVADVADRNGGKGETGEISSDFEDVWRP